jgi:hypothetical protein
LFPFIANFLYAASAKAAHPHGECGSSYRPQLPDRRAAPEQAECSAVRAVPCESSFAGADPAASVVPEALEALSDMARAQRSRAVPRRFGSPEVSQSHAPLEYDLCPLPHKAQDHVEGANFCSTVHSVHPSLPIKPFGYFWSRCLERILLEPAGGKRECLFGANSALRTTTRSPRQKKMKMIGAAALLACAGVAVAQDGACSPQQLRCRACLLGVAASPPFAAASPGAPRAGDDRAGEWSSGGRGCERAGAAPRRTTAVSQQPP